MTEAIRPVIPVVDDTADDLKVTERMRDALERAVGKT